MEAAQRARRDTLVDFFRAGNLRHSAAIERRIDAIGAEQPLHTDAAVTEPLRLLVHALLPQAALRALAFKWIRVLHRCWVDRTPYDEARYLIALQKRSAPLLKFAAHHSP